MLTPFILLYLFLKLQECADSYSWGMGILIGQKKLIFITRGVEPLHFFILPMLTFNCETNKHNNQMADDCDDNLGVEETKLCFFAIKIMISLKLGQSHENLPGF
jgi:hypothetical protein